VAPAAWAVADVGAMAAHTPANAVMRANAITALAGRKARILLLLGISIA
jgi:hypothetical protein